MPTLSIAATTIAEGNGVNATLSFIVTLSAPINTPVTFEWSTVDGSAVAPDDYTSRADELGTIAAGSTMTTLTVVVNADTTYELDETISVTLANAVGASIAQGTATGTIANDDATPVISISDATAVESDAGSVLDFTVTLASPTAVSAQVSFQSASSTATSGVDFQPASGQLTFAPGETDKHVVLPVLDDALDEDLETLEVTLSAATNATLADDTGVGTITDDDPLPRFFARQPVEVTTVEGDAGTFFFGIELVPASGRQVSVAWDWSLATPGVDFVADAGVAVFAPGETFKQVPLRVLDDLVPESTEFYRIDLSNPMNATVLQSNATLTVVDDDSPLLTMTPATVTEGNPDAGAVPATIQFNLSAPSPVNVTVFWSTVAPGFCTMTPCADTNDFVAQNRSLVIPAGQTTASDVLPISGDLLDEPDEFVVIQFQIPGGGAQIVPNTNGYGFSNVQILDNEPTPTLTLTPTPLASPGNITEGTATAFRYHRFDARLSGPSSRAIPLGLSLSSGTATVSNSSGGDVLALIYANSIGSSTLTSITFNPGSTLATFYVAINPDNLVEPNETFNVVIGNPPAHVVTPASFTFTLLNDD